MAAYCPKCNYKLSIKDWRPECPKCGVNIMYYGIEDRLREEADAAEYHHAKSQPKYDRLKFSVYGHPLAIVRIIIGLLPVVATLLPMGTVKYLLPYASGTLEATGAKTVNLVSIITAFTSNNVDIGLITGLFNSELIGKAMLSWAIAIVCLLLALVWTLVGYVMAITLSCSPKGFIRNIVFPSVGIILATVAFIAQNIMTSSLNKALPGIFEGTVAPWAYIGMIVCYAAIIAVAVIYKKKNIPVKYKDVSEFLLPYNERPSTIEKQKAKQSAAENETAGAETEKAE